MLKTILFITQAVARLYTEKRVTRAAAAMSYYLTMTIFPLIICLYSLLGRNYSKVIEILDLADKFLTTQTSNFLNEFLVYVASSNNTAMLTAGLVVVISSSSAAIRTLQTTIGEMQGGKRFQGLVDYVYSIVFSLFFMAAMYFSVIVILSGRDILNLIGRFLLIDISGSWTWLRFLVLAGIIFIIFWGIYEMSKRKSDRYDSFPGAILATVAMVVMTAAFSVFIGASSKYPLVYGSLASLILLMFWLHLCCQIIYIGAAFNISLKEAKIRRIRKKTSGIE